LTKHNEAHLAAPKVIVAPIVLSKVALTVPGWLWRTRVVDRCEGKKKEQEKKRNAVLIWFGIWSERFLSRACLDKLNGQHFSCMMRKGCEKGARSFSAPALELV
jgi:hypothetical protein